MAKLIRAIKGDVNYIKSHTLQPQWFKVLKVFILVGVLISYYLLFGFIITVIFFAVFFFLMLSVHFVYRFNTNKFQRSWLDFVVEESEGEIKGKKLLEGYQKRNLR